MVRAVPTAVEANQQARTARDARVLLWITGETEGTPFSIGLWDGVYDHGFWIDTQPRAYLSGAIVEAPQLTAEAGLIVRNFRAQLNVQRPEIRDLLLGQDLDGAAIEMRTAHFDPVTGALLGTVVDVVGKVRQPEIVQEGDGAMAAAEIVFTSASVNLDAGIALKKSDAALQRRNPGDTFRQYNNISRKVTVVWGEISAEVGGGQAPAPQPNPEEDEISSGWGP